MYAGLVIAVVAAVAAAGPEVVDRIAAVIESDIITLRELEDKAEPYLAGLEKIEGASAKAAKRLEILHQVLDIEIGEKMVDREIEANRDRLSVTEKDIDRAVEEVLKLNHLNREQLQAALYGQGLTWKEYRDKLQAQIERARLIQFKVQGKVQIREDEVLRRCEVQQKLKVEEYKVCASHVLIKIPEGADEADAQNLRGRASQLQAELSSGADFAAYALKYSDDKGTPDGQLGCFGRGEMLAEFEEAAFAATVGEITPVVRSPVGFHIIKVTDRRAASGGKCEGAALETVRNAIYQERMQSQMNQWIQQLRRRAFVEVRI